MASSKAEPAMPLFLGEDTEERMLQYSAYLEGLGKAKVSKIIELRNNQSPNRPFDLANIAIVTNIPLQKWERWEEKGLIVRPGVTLRDIISKQRELNESLQTSERTRVQLERENEALRREHSSSTNAIAEQIEQMRVSLLDAIGRETRERESANRELTDRITNLAEDFRFQSDKQFNIAPTEPEFSSFRPHPSAPPFDIMHKQGPYGPETSGMGGPSTCPPSPPSGSNQREQKKTKKEPHPAERAIPANGIVPPGEDASDFVTKTFYLPNQVAVYVKYGDIVREQVDAIVIPSDPKLSNTKGAARKVKFLAGAEAFQQASDHIVEAAGSLPVGDAISQDAMRLPATHVIHSIIPEDEGDEQAFQHMLKCFTNIIGYAQTHIKVRTLAVPVLARVAGGITKELVAQALVRVLKEFGEKSWPTLLEEIHIVDLGRTYLDKVSSLCKEAFQSVPSYNTIPPAEQFSFKPRLADNTPNAPNVSTPKKRGGSSGGKKKKKADRERKRDSRRERRSRHKTSSESESASSESTDSDSPSYREKKSYGGRSKRYSRKHSRRDDDETTDSSESSTSSSESSDRSVGDWRKVGRGRSIRSRHSPQRHHRGRSPQMPKMATYDGDSTWNAFLFQFKRTAKRYGWSKSTKLDRLMMCLRGKAVDFVKTRPKRVTTNFKRLVRHMTKRFGRHDPPITARRQLYSAKQKEDETLEEFADRIMELAVDALKGARESLVQSIVADVFLKGIKDKSAAAVAMDKDPPTIRKAVEYVRQAMHNRQALMGNHTPPRSYSTRQLSYEEEAQESYAMRTMGIPKPGVGNLKPSSGAQPPAAQKTVSFSAELPREQLKSLEAQMTEIGKFLKQNFPTSKSPTRPTREESPQRGRATSPTSPTRSSKCFNCQQEGHFSRACPKKLRSPPGSPFRQNSTPPGTPPPRRDLNL